MGAPADDTVIAARLAAALDATVAELRRSGARTEALASFDDRKSILGIRRSPVMVPKGRVWRLGVLLLDEQGGLHEVGLVTRAVEPGRVTNQSARAEERRDHRRAAFQARFAEGDTVNFDTVPVALGIADIRRGDGPLHLGDDGTVLLRWNRLPGEGGLTALAPYLADRAALLTAPPP
jgi:hypothetical protein